MREKTSVTIKHNSSICDGFPVISRNMLKFAKGGQETGSKYLENVRVVGARFIELFLQRFVGKCSMNLD